MAEIKSFEELATELTIEYVRMHPQWREVSKIRQIWCEFYETIKSKLPPKKEETKG